MPESSVTITSFPRRMIFGVACAVMLVFATLALHTARKTSVTFDEPEQIALGYASLTEPSHGFSVINFRLSQAWEALPLLFFKPPPRFPTVEERRAAAIRNVGYGKLFLFSGGRDAQEVLFASRVMVIVSGIALGFFVFQQSRRLHGELGGMLSLALFAFCPLVIAHSALATTDIPMALLFTLATFRVWRLLDEPGWQNVVWAGLASGAAAATKISAFLLVPVTMVLLAVRAAEEIRLVGGRKAAGALARQAAGLGGAVLMAWAVVWLVYGGPVSAPPSAPEPWAIHPTLQSKWAPHIVAAFREWRLLPDGYLFDLHQFVHASEIRRTFLLGRYSLEGWWYYFPLAWLVKNPLALVVAPLAAGLAAWRLCSKERTWRRDWREYTPWIVLILVYGGFAVSSNLNIGARHLLSLYPAALICAGMAAKLFPERRRRVLLVCALGGTAGLETALAHPWHLSYYNAFAGGSSRGYRVMIDSSTDWGESLLSVRQWLDRRKRTPDAMGEAKPVYLSCFANTDLGYYGLSEPGVVGLPQFHDLRPIRPYLLAPGTYLISATMLQNVYGGNFMGPWRPRYEKLYQERMGDMAVLAPAMRSQAGLDALFAADGLEPWLRKIQEFDYLRFGRLCAYLRRRGPDEQITPGMLVFELSVQDLEAALAGPPPELRRDDVIEGAARFADEDLDFLK